MSVIMLTKDSRL